MKTMTFNGEEIGIPTLAIIEKCIKQLGYKLMPGKVYSFWNKHHWIDKKKYPIESVEEAVEKYNEKFPRRKHHCSNKALRKIRRNVKRRAAQRKANKKFKEEHPHIPYREQLKDKRWLDFREKILNLKGRVCEKCGTSLHLQVHHPKYKSMRYAWEYKPEEVVVLCDFCHAKEHGLI